VMWNINWEGIAAETD